jgi:hypothetical protein
MTIVTAPHRLWLSGVRIASSKWYMIRNSLPTSQRGQTSPRANLFSCTGNNRCLFCDLSTQTQAQAQTQAQTQAQAQAHCMAKREICLCCSQALLNVRLFISIFSLTPLTDLHFLIYLLSFPVLRSFAGLFPLF